MKKFSNIVFSLLFVLLLFLPLAASNFKKDAVSEIDNKYLPEIQWELNSKLPQQIENYLTARIGFRTEALDLYQRLNDSLFHLLEHPNYMYGENGQVFYKLESYLADYQRLNIDEEEIDRLVSSVDYFSDYAREQGCAFIYLLVPDKKTVYAEDLPDSIHVKDTLSRTDRVLEKLSQTDVNYLWAKDIMIEGKSSMEVCNKEYDAGHWNENGAFLVYQELYQKIREIFPQVSPLSAEDYDISPVLETSLPASHFSIREEVPEYTLKNSTAVDDYQWAWDNLNHLLEDRSSHLSRHLNPTQADKPKLLIICDSYMIGDEKSFENHFSEVTMFHRKNLSSAETYEELLQTIRPDLVIYENPERGISYYFPVE